MFCVGINFDYTLSVPLQVLKLLAADFDGDAINVMHIINAAFFEAAYEIFNPRNNMYISRNNGLFNKDVMVQRDTIINANILNDLSLHKYNEEELIDIQRIKEKQLKMAS